MRKLNKLEEALCQLPPRDITVLCLHFGLYSFEPQTTLTISLLARVTRGRIREIAATGLRRLRHPSHSRALRDCRPQSDGERRLLAAIFGAWPVE